MVERAKQTGVHPFNLLPHAVYSSQQHSVSVSVESIDGEQLSKVTNLNNSLDKLRNGPTTKSKDSNVSYADNIYGGQWYFIIDENNLKLVSAEPDMMYIAPEDLR